MILKEKEEGDRCENSECNGVLYYPKVENCSCHINPPCHECVSVCLTCKDCGEEYPGEGTEKS